MRLVRAGASAATFRLALVSAVAAVLATSCHVPGTGGSGTSTTGSGSITVAVVPGIDNAPLQVAVQDGLFRQHGLSVTIRPYGSLSQVIAALKSGQATIAGGDYTDFFDAQSRGAVSLSLIADGYDAVANSMAILTLPRKGWNITAAQDLQGKTVASPPAQGIPIQPGLPFNMPTLAAEQVLQSDGLSPSSVKWQQTSPANMLAELNSGQVRAILATEPYIFEAEEKFGATEVVDASSGVTGNLPLSGYFSLSSYAKQQPANVEAFRAALSQAQTNASMGGQVQAVLPQYAGITHQQAAMVTLGSYPTALSVGQVQRVVSLMVDAGMMPTQLSLSSHCKVSNSGCLAVAP
jgi:NitT/TauT family transport system substrate-binding protein